MVRAATTDTSHQVHDLERRVSRLEAACMVRASEILYMPIQGTSPYLLLAVIMAYVVQDRSIQQAPPVSSTV